MGRRNSWLALGTAGAIGAAAMYGINRMNRNGGMQQVGQNVQNSEMAQNLQNALPKNNQ